MNNFILLPGGEKFYYISVRPDIIQRVQGNGKVKYMNMYLGENEDLITYKYNRKETWYYKKPKNQIYMVVKKQIEKRKQDLRLKGKYKQYKKTDCFSYRKMLKMYIHITDACGKAKQAADEMFKQLGYNKKKDKISIQQVIDESKQFKWAYNYLFTEYFEEEAN